MTKRDKSARRALNRLAATLADDILAASDHDILEEFLETHGDAESHAAEMRALFERTVLRANKARLAAAKAGAEASRTANAGAKTVDITEARRLLRAVLTMPNAPAALTLAARKESELSDADVTGMIDDLRELGLPIPDPGPES